MECVLKTSDPLARALARAGVSSSSDPANPLVFELVPPGDHWDDVAELLARVYEESRAAAQAGSAVVYVVHSDDLLGRRGAGNAMVATGALSAARTLAFEGRKKGVPTNVIAIEDDSDLDAAARWIVSALEPGGPTGELIRIGGGHIGKALP
jgi:hypothetical protein